MKYIHQEAGRGVGEVTGAADKHQSVCHLCYFMESSVLPTVPDTKEELSVLGKSGEVLAARKLSVPQQVLQYSYSS